MLQFLFFLNAAILNFLLINESWKRYHSLHKMLGSNCFNDNNNVSWAANQHIRMISEDTEDWSHENVKIYN